MYSFLQIAIQKTTKIIENTNSYDSINKSRHLIIRCLNTIGSQQKILTTRAISYLLNMSNHITNYKFIYIPW